MSVSVQLFGGSIILSGWVVPAALLVAGWLGGRAGRDEAA